LSLTLVDNENDKIRIDIYYDVGSVSYKISRWE